MSVWHARRPGWDATPLWLRVLRAVATLAAAIGVVVGLWFWMAFLAVMATPAPR